MTSKTFINPDGKLITHKKYVNWEGFREVEGVNCLTSKGSFPHVGNGDFIIITNSTVTVFSFTIQD